MLSRNKTVNPKCDVILLNEATIQRVTTARLLGVIVDKHLNREGVNGIAKKSKSCVIISRIQNILDIKSKKKMYYSLIHPYLLCICLVLHLSNKLKKTMNSWFISSYTSPRIVIQPQSHSPHLNTLDWYQQTTQTAQLRMTIIFFCGKWCTMYNNNWTTWCRWWIQLQLPGANQLILNNQLQHPGLNTKKQKHKVQLISVLTINENTLTSTISDLKTHLNLKNTWLWDTNEELHWISCRSNLR